MLQVPLDQLFGNLARQALSEHTREPSAQFHFTLPNRQQEDSALISGSDNQCQA